MQVKYWLFGLIVFGVVALLLVRHLRNRARETDHVDLPLEAGQAARGSEPSDDVDVETAPAVLGPPEGHRKSA